MTETVRTRKILLRRREGGGDLPLWGEPVSLRVTVQPRARLFGGDADTLSRRAWGTDAGDRLLLFAETGQTEPAEGDGLCVYGTETCDYEITAVRVWPRHLEIEARRLRGGREENGC